MTNNRSIKKKSSNRPYLITFVCFTILVCYLVLPIAGSVFIYVKWDNPSIQKIFNEISNIVMGNLPSNYYLMISYVTLTLIGIVGMPIIIMVKFWGMKKNAISICKVMCLIQIGLFYSHFLLLDELMYRYGFLKETLIVIYSSSIIFLISGFLYSKKME